MKETNTDSNVTEERIVAQSTTTVAVSGLLATCTATTITLSWMLWHLVGL